MAESSQSFVVSLLFGLALLGVGAAALPAAPASAADLEPDPHGIIETVPADGNPHRVWVADRIFRHSLLFDGDTATVLGTIDTNWNIAGRAPLSSPGRGEFYMVESVYSRGHYGERSDFVTIYDATTLAVTGEVQLPVQTAEAGHGVALVDLLDGGRFLAVFAQNPAASVAIVDLDSRSFVTNIDAAGCAGVYPTGERSFAMLCGNGTVTSVLLDEKGGDARLVASEPFFDVVADPLTEKGVRDGSRWYFASFDGWLHEVETSGERPELLARWSMFDDADRGAGWRIGGVQHLALHRASGRLYALVHQGGAGTHKDPGTEIRVYDLGRRDVVARWPVPSLVAPFLRPFLDLERDSTAYSLLDRLLPSPGAHSILVTQDENPLLFVRHNELGAIGVLDAANGRHLRDLEEAGISGGKLALP
jgi:methylamine dehydrogenase heavy chain